MPHVRRVIIEMVRGDGQLFKLVLDEDTLRGRGLTAADPIGRLPKAIYFKPEEALVAWAIINDPVAVAQQASAISAAYHAKDARTLHQLIQPRGFPPLGDITQLLQQGVGAQKGHNGPRLQALASDGTTPIPFSEEIVIHDQKCDWY